MRDVSTQIEYCESIVVGEPPAAEGAVTRPHRRLLVHGGFIVLATEFTETQERPVGSGLLGEESATVLASLVRAARWEGFPPPGSDEAGAGGHWATISFDDGSKGRVVLRFERQTGIDGVVVRDGVAGFTSTLLTALGTLLDAAWALGNKGVAAWQAPPLDAPRDTLPTPPPRRMQ